MKKWLPVIVCIFVFVSCKKSSEELQLPAINDYAPLAKGKYITYTLDSLIYTNFGTVETHHFYQVKFVVDDAITDNQGRPAFRIVRYIKPQNGGNFVPDNTFSAINTGNTFETTENNLRFKKLVQPISNGTAWKGNSFISTIGLGLEYLDDWDYTYESVGEPARVGIIDLPNTLTVNQRDYSDGLPINSGTTVAQRDLASEIYAKDIGMVYKKFCHFEYQQSTHAYEGYGITYTMIDHN